MKITKKITYLLSILPILLGVFILLGLAASCGKKTNNKRGNNNYNPRIPPPVHPTNPTGTDGRPIPPGGPGDIQAAIRQVAGQTRCTQGSRFHQMSFISQGGGMLVPQGHQPSQGVWYAGASFEGDLLFIQKINQGLQVIGYNVILALCSDNITIGRGAQLSGFQISGVRLTESPQCSVNKVGFASISLRSNTTPLPIQIFFSPINGCY